jgi:hypothetical protein
MIIKLTHDETISELLSIVAKKETKSLVTNLFISALATGAHRGLTPLAAYYSSIHIPQHTWTPYEFNPQKLYYPPDKIPCSTCGLTHSQEIRPTYILDDRKSGRCTLEPSYDNLIDLRDLENINICYEKNHIHILNEVLGAIDQADNEEKPSELEKRLSALKIIPKSNKASRIWALRILAELGIITNPWVDNYSSAKHFYPFSQRNEWDLLMHDKALMRADPVWPLSTWNGSCKVNWSLAHEIFPQLQDC